MLSRDAKRLVHSYLWESRVKSKVTAVCFVHDEWDAMCMTRLSQSCKTAAVTSSSCKQQSQAAFTKDAGAAVWVVDRLLYACPCQCLHACRSPAKVAAKHV